MFDRRIKLLLFSLQLNPLLCLVFVEGWGTDSDSDSE